MICPNCGREKLETRNYCPSCGLKLQPIRQALTNELTHKQSLDTSQEKPGLPVKRRPTLFTLGFFLMFSGLILGVLGINQISAKAGVISAIIGMGLIAYSSIRWDGRKATRLPSKIMTPAVPTTQLPNLVEAASITEHTTRKLDVNLVPEKQKQSADLLIP